jgi:type I restriction enzyme S subunit
MSTLPPGWTTVNVAELAEINPKNFLPDETIIGFVPMNLLPTRFAQKFVHEKRKWGEVKKGYTHFQNGDVLLAKITPCFENGKSAIAEGLAGQSHQAISSKPSSFCL